jgi:[histone H3]-trimethyl-L-lysine9/36 demethylase
MEVTTFRPTVEEFSMGLAEYVHKYVETDSHTKICGLAKVIPPDTWWINGKEAEELCLKEASENKTVVRPIVQHLSGVRGTYRVDLVDAKPLSVANFRDRAKKLEARGNLLTERDFWRSLSTTSTSSQYGADQVGTLFKDRELQSGWNLNKIDSVLSAGLGVKTKLGGITTPMLYYGEPKALFAWHCEDMDLNSVNYLHFGASKIWYAIAPEHAARLESLAQSYFGECANECSEFMRHKNILISPSHLERSNIPYCRAEQNEREFMITLPRSYHCGWNKGWNCAESVNFATPNWIKHGRMASWCKCFDYTFKCDLDEFVHSVRMKKSGLLNDMPNVGDLIVVVWKGWGKSLVRIKGVVKGSDGSGSSSGGSSSSSSSSSTNKWIVCAIGANVKSESGRWEIDPELDEWRFPRKEDYTPSIGDILSVITRGSKNKKHQQVRVVGYDTTDQNSLFRLMIVESVNKSKHHRWSFHPKECQWFWPELVTKEIVDFDSDYTAFDSESHRSEDIREFFPIKKKRKMGDGWCCIPILTIDNKP